MEYHMNRCWLNNVCVSRGLSARIGSRAVNPKLEYLYYCAPIVSHCLYCRIKPGERNVVFFGQKVCHGFRLK